MALPCTHGLSSLLPHFLKILANIIRNYIVTHPPQADAVSNILWDAYGNPRRSMQDMYVDFHHNHTDVVASQKRVIKEDG